MKLTRSQLDALRRLRVQERAHGYALSSAMDECGVRQATLRSLERRGMVESVRHIGLLGGRRWRLTLKGLCRTG